MRHLRLFVRYGVALLASLSIPVQPALAAAATPTLTAIAELQTVAERSGFKATSKSDEVRAFLDALAAGSKLVRVSSLRKSGEGREIPLAILADPPVSKPEEAAKSGKLLVLCVGNIHAGEVDGKEGLLAILRDIAAKPDAHADLLKKVILAVIPNYNADGNDKTARDNRPGQVGPEEGQGQRENAAGLDLNRDFVKLEAPETRALVGFIRRWDPAVVIDTHTTNGSYHRYVLTYGGPKNPAGDRTIIDYVNQTLLPGVGARVKEKHAMETFFYGNFTRNHAAWEDYPDEPRFGVPYVGMRNRISILTEAYTYATYEQRVRAQIAFVGECLAWAAEKKAEITALLTKADEAAIRAGREPGEKDTVAIRSVLKAFDAKVTVPGYVEKSEGPRSVRTDTTKDYVVEHRANFVADARVRRARAYVLPAAAGAAVETLQRHGVQVEELRESVEVDVEVYRVDKISRAERPFQGHRTERLEVTARTESRRLEPGMFVVKTAQKLGALASYLLEPAAADGLATWNFFDAGLVQGGDFAAMRLVAPVALLTVAAPVLAEERTTPRAITFDDWLATTPPNLAGAPTSGHEWLEDGEKFTQTRDGKLRTYEARTGRTMEVIDAEAAAKALGALPAIGEKAAKAVVGRARWNEARTAFFAEHENDLYYYRPDDGQARRLTSTPETEEVPSFSSDGRFIAFVRKNDLWVVDVAGGGERALTTGGTETLRHGKADWVYYEEIFGRSWKVYWWAPDSSRLAYMEVDSSPVPIHAIVNNSKIKQTIEHTPYPRAGEPNPKAKVFTVSAAGGTPVEIDFSNYEPANLLVTLVVWRPDSSGVVVGVTNRVQTWLDLLAAPVAGGSGKVLFRETTQAWVETSPLVRFLKDGSFLFASERSGWKHLYHYGKDGKLLKQVTDGEWECRGIARLDEAEGVAYVMATKDNPLGENLYRVKLDGSGITRLTQEAGAHRTTVAPKGDLFVDSWSDRGQPAQVALRSLQDGAVVRVLDTNPVRDLEKYRLAEREYFQITTPDGFVLEATLVKPLDFDPAKKYPVWFMTYAGPHAPGISDAWSGARQDRTVDQALATAGILAFRADPRSASGKGAVSAWAAYKKLGQQELKDIETAISWLTANPWADATRVGMAGHSYGGFITAYAMTHSKRFAAGIAGAPVTDWREYDSVYTERYMLTPQENPDGYRDGSVIESAKNLHGRLLLAHGMIDDNVHLQNSTRLIKALQEANKPFELMLYPDPRHGIAAKHYRQLQVDFIFRTMLGRSAPAPAPEPAPARGDEPRRRKRP
ncbi:MAG: hypothetical protein EXS37_18140 [Opitutus sp.]|nr:hypothetical protein [Opitutus sp.]